MLEYIERYLIPKERDALDARKRSTSFAPSSTSYHPSSMSTGPPTDTASQHFSYMEIFIRPVVHLWKEQCEQTPSSISWMTPIETDGTPDDLKADGASTCYKRLNYVETQVVDASRNTKGSQAAASRYPERKQGYKSESFRDVFQRISSDSNDRSTSLDSFNNPPSKSNGSDTTTLSTSSLLPPRQRASREAKASPKSSNKAPRARKKSHLLKSTHRYDLDPGRQTRAKAHANAVGCSGTPLPRTPEVPSADDSYDDSDDGDVSSNNMIDIPEGNDRLSEAGEIQPSHSTTRIFEQPEYDIVQTQELTQPDNDETETDYMIESDNGSPRWRNAGRKVASAHGEDQNYSGSTKLAAHAKLEQAEMKRLAAEKRLQAHVATSATTSQERNYPKSRKKGITDKRTRTQGATRSSFHKDQAGSTGGDQTKKATLRHHSLAIESRNQSPWPTLSTPDPDVSSSKWHQIAGLEAQVDVVKFRMALILPYGQRIQDTVNYVRLADASSLYKSSLVKTKREEDDNNPLRNSPALTEIIKMDATKMSLDEKWIEWTEFGSDKDHHGPSPRLWACIVAAQRLVVPEAITPFSMKSSLSKKTTHRSATIVRAGDEVKYENDNENEARGENAERIPLVIDEFTQLEYAPKWLYNQFMHMLNRLRRLVEGDKLDQDFVLEALEAIRFEKDFVPFLKLFIPDNGASEPSRRDLKMAYRPEAKSTLTISEIQALKAVRRSAQAPGINLGDSQSGGGGGGGLGTTSMEAENPTDVFFELFGAKKDRDPSKAASVREMPPWARLAGSSSATQTSATSGPMDGFASQQQVLKRLPSPFEEREMEKDQNANRPWKRKA
ncbi:hypothetical protein BGZ83_010310 [Gryganskiella cystojenkinii]|nr:hypothetical protein BGZ83_010310 [Gryganskiella cystojenkinii]